MCWRSQIGDGWVIRAITFSHRYQTVGFLIQFYVEADNVPMTFSSNPHGDTVISECIPSHKQTSSSCLMACDQAPLLTKQSGDLLSWNIEGKTWHDQMYPIQNQTKSQEHPDQNKEQRTASVFPHMSGTPLLTMHGGRMACVA